MFFQCKLPYMYVVVVILNILSICVSMVIIIHLSICVGVVIANLYFFLSIVAQVGGKLAVYGVWPQLVHPPPQPLLVSAA